MWAVHAHDRVRNSGPKDTDTALRDTLNVGQDLGGAQCENPAEVDNEANVRADAVGRFFLRLHGAALGRGALEGAGTHGQDEAEPCGRLKNASLIRLRAASRRALVDGSVRFADGAPSEA